MPSHKTFIHNIRHSRSSGFTLIELLIVIGIVGFLAAMGAVVGLDFIARTNFNYELESAASALQKARSSAVANIGESPHGVYFGNSGSIVLFRGADFASRNTSFDLAIESSAIVSYSGASEVVFSRLSGATSGGTVTVASAGQTAQITVNAAGGIEY